jgi:Zn-dependent peptidase ImmA (M78 family)
MRKYGTNNPFELAGELGAYVRYDDIGGIKGYYCCMNRIRLIVINRNLDENMGRLVCAHELGHDRLHRNMAVISPLRDTGFNSSALHEMEANQFAANLLVNEDDFFELASRGYTDEQVAAALNIRVELVRIKSELLRRAGIQLRLLDIPNSDFLK